MLSLIRKRGLQTLLSFEFKICVEKLKYFARIKEIVQLSYKRTKVESFEIGDKRELEIFLLNDGKNECSSRTDNNDDGDNGVNFMS